MIFIDKKIEAVCRELQKYISDTIIEVSDILYAPCEYKEIYKDENIPDSALLWSTFEKDMRIGGIDKHYWFKFKVKTLDCDIGTECVLSVITGKNDDWDALNPQGLVYLNGKMVQGLDINHTDVVLDFNREYEIWIYFYTGMYDCMVDFNASLCLNNKRVEKLYYDLSVPLEGTRYINPDSKDYFDTINTLNSAVQLLDLRVPKSDEFYKSIDAAIDYLDVNFYNGICGKSDITVNCIGHTHIDVAWLWTLAQTREKAQRSFATVINLMKQYPEYKFMSSQPQLYSYVKDSAPDLYKKIKKAVADGKWEVDGAMWLEADCNLTSGESLVRQIMFGKRFMKEEFGVDSKILWLPDVFGYSAAMPQILKKCGVDKFVTSKISWNETNKMPYDVFMWQGIDGTEIFTSFLPARDSKPFGESDCEDRYTTYNGYIRPSQVLGTWNRFQQKEYSNETIITFGWGDGGGGPTKDMLEQQKRLSYGLPGFPKTRIDFAKNYLSRLETSFFENSEKLKRMPKWVGELYLELHRGTYTSMAKNKKNNRKSELAYQRIETLSVIDMLLGGQYPQEQINDGWQEILLNQFHDIIPGSSILEVYEDCDKAYAKILKNAESIQENKLENIKKHIKSNGGTLVYNPNGFEINGAVKVDGITAHVENVPAFGWCVIENPKITNCIKVSDNTIENKFFKLIFEKGKITSIYGNL